MTKKPQPEATSLTLYSTFWRWHFYAGLFCIPFAIWLSITGTIYLFKPQIDAWIDSPYDHVIRTSTRASPTAAVQKAIESVPGSVLHAYELPESDTSALRVMVGKGTDVFRVYLHPETLEVLRTIPEEDRLMKIIFHLHGDLLLGDRGSMLMELAASWMIVLILTGLYLWWPRGNSGLAGTIYPRLDRGGRAFWRDLHSVTGLWVAFFLLFLLVSGLPWAKSWGGMLKEVRKWSETTPVKQDWSTGKSSEMAERLAANTQPAKPQSGEHKGHADHGGHNPDDNQLIDYTLLNTIVANVEPLNLAAPVLVTPPSKSSPKWAAKSDAQNRPLRVNLKFDNTTGTITERKDFSQRPLLDRIIGTGVAAHEGQLFGWPNQLLGVFTTMGVILVSVSSFVMWWSRKPQNALGAPRKINARPVPLFLWLLIVSLGTVLPLMGLSLIVILIIEFIALKRIKSVRHYLGLSH
jgi:uncharacterized iron-regulated membrane protein